MGVVCGGCDRIFVVMYDGIINGDANYLFWDWENEEKVKKLWETVERGRRKTEEV